MGRGKLLGAFCVGNRLVLTQLTSVGVGHSAFTACKYRQGGDCGSVLSSSSGELNLGVEDAEIGCAKGGKDVQEHLSLRAWMKGPEEDAKAIAALSGCPFQFFSPSSHSSIPSGDFPWQEQLFPASFHPH